MLAVEAAAGLFEPTAPLAARDAIAAEVDAFVEAVDAFDVDAFVEVDGFEVEAFEAVDAFDVDAFEAVDAFEDDAFVGGFSGVFSASAPYTSRRLFKRRSLKGNIYSDII